MRVSHYAVCTDYAVPNLKKKRKNFGESFVGLLENDGYPNRGTQLGWLFPTLNVTFIRVSRFISFEICKLKTGIYQNYTVLRASNSTT